ncbi:MAG: EF-P beta-lysylation protein EpmB [Gammaproteobacteria bacterium]|nr:EF-P beta-lysylation protein EpmB [Gammaproteobacteria bacterium]
MSTLWQHQLANNITSLDELISQTANENLRNSFCSTANQQFKIKIPADFLPGLEDIDADPLLAQVLPHANEMLARDGYRADPVGDLQAMASPGLIHKYRSRALFIVTGACAIHCRYCFRRHFPYADAQINKDNWQPAFNYLHAHEDISEIILSGGDPLMISDDKLEYLLNQLMKIPHIKRLRIHSRIPSVLPSRINEKLISLLQASRFLVSLVTHINHPDELNQNNKTVFSRLKNTDIQLLNQSVLLFNINNKSETLIELSEKLYEFGILPYYLHLLDPVQGAAHFSVKESDAIALVNTISGHLPGYLVPKLVKEIAGEQAKTRVL